MSNLDEELIRAYLNPTSRPSNDLPWKTKRSQDTLENTKPDGNIKMAGDITPSAQSPTNQSKEAPLMETTHTLVTSSGNRLTVAYNKIPAFTRSKSAWNDAPVQCDSDISQFSRNENGCSNIAKVYSDITHPAGDLTRTRNNRANPTSTIFNKSDSELNTSVENSSIAGCADSFREFTTVINDEPEEIKRQKRKKMLEANPQAPLDEIDCVSENVFLTQITDFNKCLYYMPMPILHKDNEMKNKETFYRAEKLKQITQKVVRKVKSIKIHPAILPTDSSITQECRASSDLRRIAKIFCVQDTLEQHRNKSPSSEVNTVKFKSSVSLINQRASSVAPYLLKTKDCPTLQKRTKAQLSKIAEMFCIEHLVCDDVKTRINKMTFDCIGPVPVKSSSSHETSMDEEELDPHILLKYPFDMGITTFEDDQEQPNVMCNYDVCNCVVEPNDSKENDKLKKKKSLKLLARKLKTFGKW